MLFEWTINIWNLCDLGEHSNTLKLSFHTFDAHLYVFCPACLRYLLIPETKRKRNNPTGKKELFFLHYYLYDYCSLIMLIIVHYYAIMQLCSELNNWMAFSFHRMLFVAVFALLAASVAADCKCQCYVNDVQLFKPVLVRWCGLST